MEHPAVQWAAALQAARVADFAAAEAAHRVTETSAELERRKIASKEAEEEAKAAEQVQEVAKEELDDMRRAHAAAHAASTSRPGDPCPVCRRTLADDFTRPSPPGEDAALAACRRAENRAKDAAKAATVAATQRDAMSASLADLCSLADQAARRRESELARAVEQLGRGDLSQSDDVLLADLRRAADKSTGDVVNARAEARIKHDAATAAAAEVDPLSRALARRESELATARLALERRQARAETLRCSVPEQLRPVAPLTVSDLTTKLAVVRDRQQELAVVGKELGAIRVELSGVRSQTSELRRRHRDEVERPARDLRRQIEILADRAHNAATILELEALPSPPPGGLAEESNQPGRPWLSLTQPSCTAYVLGKPPLTLRWLPRRTPAWPPCSRRSPRLTRFSSTVFT